MLPHAQDRIGEWRRRRQEAGCLLVAVDFDGTLAPIVDRPEDAAPLPEGVAALRRLAARTDTEVAIVSGRGLVDVRERLGLGDLVYAGNHGMEIEGPDFARVHQEAQGMRPALERCDRCLAMALEGVEGAQVEDKGLTLSIHYRRVAEAGERERVRAAVRSCCGDVTGLRITEGKMVVEVRPDVEWDKGRATRLLLDAVEERLGRVVPVLFLGDDRTDEDAFEALRGEGDGILVAEDLPEHTAAAAWVRSPEEVAQLLDALARDG